MYLISPCADRFPCVLVSTAKVQQGSTHQFPIIQGLQRQEQIAKHQQENASSNVTTTAARTQQTTRPLQRDTQPHGRTLHHPRPAYLQGQKGTVGVGGEQMGEDDFSRDTAQAAYSSFDAPMDPRQWVKTEGDEPHHAAGYYRGMSPRSPLPFYYHTSSITEEPQYSPTGQTLRNYPARPLWAHDSPANNVDSPANNPYPGANPMPFLPRNDRVSLEAPIRRGRISLPTAPRQDFYRGNQQESSSFSNDRSGHVPASLMNARMSRDLNASKYFSDNRAMGATHDYRPAQGLEERSESDVVFSERNWSTLPVKRKAYSKNPASLATKPFRLPGKLFGGARSTDVSQKSGPAHRSSDSATEVVVPLRRTKLTLFEPSPPKLHG